MDHSVRTDLNRIAGDHEYLESSLLEPEIGASKGFAPGHLFMVRFLRGGSVPIGGMGIRVSGQSEAALSLFIASNMDGEPGQVLAESHVRVAKTGGGCDGTGNVVAVWRNLLYGLDGFWLGFRLAEEASLPIKSRRFAGVVTKSRVDEVKVGQALRELSLQTVVGEERLGEPILFPIYKTIQR